MLPSLPRPGVSARAEAALGRAVELASVPATARLAVPDAVLASFAPPPAPLALRNPWAPGEASPAPQAVPADPRERAIFAVTGVAAPAVGTAAPAPSAPQGEAQVGFLAARDSLAAAADALLAEGGTEEAAALDQARMAAGRLLGGPPPRHAAGAAGGFAAADAVLARLQDGAASDALRDGLARARQALSRLAADPRAAPVAAPIAALAGRRKPLPAPTLRMAAPVLPPRRVPALPAIPAPTAAPATLATDSWGTRATPPPPGSAVALAEAPPAVPYDTLTAGVLSSIAAAGSLMRRNGFGGLRDPGGLDRLAAAIVESSAAQSDPGDAEDRQRLMQWCGLARQAGLLRARFGLLPWDPDQQPALAEALSRRARWLAERPPWPRRNAAAAGLEQWLPLVDCAEALDLPLQGHHALHNLGRALRRVAGHSLPRPHDMAGLARGLATEDAMATLIETTGLDPATEAGAARLVAMARGLETLPDLPPADAEGVVDVSTLARLRHLDRGQAGALGLEDLTGTEIPLLSRGLPVLAALDARRRYRLLRAAPPTMAP